MRPRNWFGGIAILTLAAALASGQPGPITINTTSLPDGSIGTPYLQLLSASTTITGVGITWSLSAGALPGGLNLAADGTISGIPNTSGLASFVVQASQTTIEATFSTTQPLTITVTGIQLGITTNPSLPPGSVGVAYTLQLAATGGVPQYSWNLDSGAFPGGVGLNSITGVISGTPTGAGAFSFQLSVTDQAGGKSTGAFTLVVAPPLFISTAPALPPAASGAPYLLALTAAGGSPPYTWSAPGPAGSLPPGLALDPVTGNLAGTPTTNGSYQFMVGVTDGAGRTASKLLTLNIAALLAIVTPSPLPNGGVGTSYQLQLSATGGTPAYIWSITSGALPAGLTLDPAAGTISGTPTATGTYQFVVGVTDAVGRSASAPLTLNITSLLAIATPSPLPNGTVGSSYRLRLSASGGTPGYTWAVTSGALPAGLTLDVATGSLSGTPTVSGIFQFLMRVTDAAGATVSKSLTLNITEALAISTPSPLPNGGIGTAYQLQLSATGGTPPYTWSITAGALPAGLSFDPSTGSIFGTPTTGGSYQLVIGVADAAGGAALKTLTLNITALPSIVTQSPLPNGSVGTAYLLQLSATGGTPPYTWSISSGALPAGFTLNPTTGSLSGTPTTIGTYQFVAAVTDAAGHNASNSLTLNITNLLVIATPSPLPNGSIGSPYQQQLSATGGTSALTWSIAAGALPAGVNLDPATGLLSGTPTAGGAFNVTIGVKDAVQSASKAFQLTIAPALPAVTITGLPDTPTPATQPALGISLGAAYTQDLTGHATLTFVPDSSADDPAVQFTTGGRSADFQIPAGTTQAVFGSSSLGVQTGTVAGTITVTLQILAAGLDVTPTPAPTKVLKIAPAPPVITSAKLTSTSGGFDLAVIGFATSREVTGATVHLTPASGTTLATSDFTIPLTTVFPAWYQDPTSAQYGSQFSLHIPFGVQNATNAVGSLSVTLTNAHGTSAAANATF